MRILIVVFTTLVLIACGHKESPEKAGGYISMNTSGNCTLSIIQPGSLPKISISATACEFPVFGNQHAYVKQCGRLDFVSSTELPSTKALVCTNCEQLAQQYASCPLRVAYTPVLWQVK